MSSYFSVWFAVFLAGLLSFGLACSLSGWLTLFMASVRSLSDWLLSPADFLPDPRGAGLHLAFQFSYVRTELVPTHSLRDKGTKGQRDKGKKGQRDKGTLKL